VDDVRGMGNYQHIGLDAGLPTLSVITLPFLLYLYLSGVRFFHVVCSFYLCHHPVSHLLLFWFNWLLHILGE
jgi:hypothetical protein